MKRLIPLLMIVVAACSNGQDDAATTTSASAPGSSEPTTTTTTAPIRTTTTGPSVPTPVLDDGRPATFLAVTTDYEAVEVDTLTGEIVRSFGRRATAADLETAEFPPNVVDALWRTTSGAMILVSECCEPAAGRINYLSREGALSSDYDDRAVMAWAAVPSPVSDEVILVGYSTSITIPNPTADGETLVFMEDDGSGVGAIGWSADAGLIHWYDAVTHDLVTWDPTSSIDDTSRVPVTWLEENQTLSGLEARASGELVSFLTTYDDDFETVNTEMVEYSAETGTIIDRFAVETGSIYGGFDPTGTHFIYTTRDGLVRWRGPDDAGTLAEGYLSASW